MTPFNFGGTPTPAFGGTTGFSFGGSTSTTSTPSFASSFTNPATNVSGTGLTFGSTPTSSATNTFGTSTAFPSATSSLFPAAGQTATTSTGFNFGGIGTGGLSTSAFGTTNTGFGATNTGFGTTNTGFGSTNTGFGTTNTGFGTTNTGFGTTNTGFGTTNTGFGATNTGFGTTNTGLGAIGTGFGTTNTGLGAIGTGFGATNTGFGAANTGFGVAVVPSATATSTTATIGLGGVDLQASSIHDASTTAKKDKAVRETFIPNELVVTVDAFKKYMKEQKNTREEMARVSSKNIFKVQSEIASLKQQLSVISNGLQRNEIAIAKLKQESSEELRNAEIIQRTKDTPLALQCENTAPSAYFDNLATRFENQMQSYRLQIEQLERHLVSLSHAPTITPSVLAYVMKRLHDSFVIFAAQLQTTHQQVQFKKDEFLALRANENDGLNIFSSRNTLSTKIPRANISLSASMGPDPLVFGSSAAQTVVSNLKRQQLQGLGSGGANLSVLGLNTSNFLSSPLNNSFGTANSSVFKPLGSTIGGTSSFGNAGFGSSNINELNPQSPFSLTTQKPFQLQKPPSGNKRGKRYTSA